MNRNVHPLWPLLLCGALAACGNSRLPGTGTATATVTTPSTTVPVARYDLANGCYTLKSLGATATAAKQGDGSYALVTTSTGATPFYMKPTALGKYMFYTPDALLLSEASGAVNSVATVGENTDWTIDTDTSGAFTVFSAAASQSLVAAGGKLTLAPTPASGDSARFTFEPAGGCTPFPEAEVNATGDTFKGTGVDQPVLGFADVHNHLSATTFLGGAHYGAPFHRFGITTDLANCQAVHGPNGSTDIIGNFEGFNTPVKTHDTVGWPTFVDWPSAASLTHEGTYYKWLERAWKAGLRIIINNLVENETLCALERNAQASPTGQCNEMINAESQAHFMYDLQDYIDAQEGGPGKGWFRIVTSPAQARQVINDGKLAVVLGIEISHLFDCSISYDALGNDVPGCTTATIDKEINDLYALGVREMFSIHEFDNAFGGNGIFNGLVLNFGNFKDTGRFWKTYDCSTEPAFYPLGATMTTSDPSGSLNPLASALASASGGVAPVYPSTPQCNARGLTSLGRYAFQKMMEKKIIMDIDHLEVSIKGDLLTMAEQQNPPYPVISAHGGHGGITQSQAQRIINDGGLIYPYHGNAPQWVALLNNALTPLKNSKYFFGMGYGADTNGLGAQAGPCSDCKAPVKYPFTLFKGDGWGPEFANIAPVTFDREVTGERVFDVNAEGQATYGLKADWVEQVRIEGGQQAISTLYRSAEAYLQMWERTINR